MITSSPSPKPFAPTSYAGPSTAAASSSPFSAPRSSTTTTATAGPSFSPRAFRTSNSSPRNSTARSSTSSAAAAAAAASTILSRSPKRPTADAATQYSPPDWPPTSSRSSLRQAHDSSRPAVPLREQVRLDRSHSSSARPLATPASGAARAAPPFSKVAHDAQSRASPASVPPPHREPILRETPQTSLASSRSNADRAPTLTASADALNTPAAKRPKPSSQPPQPLPADYQDCPPKVLATLISGLLMDLIHHNDKIQMHDNHLTRFHSRTPPGISVHDYLQRLTFHATLPAPILLSMIFYIDSLCAAFEPFTINSLTVHRFLIAAATVAAKGLMDVFWTNSTYAKVGGVSLKELALLELELLVRVEWRIIPSTDKLAEYYRGVVERHPDYVLEASRSSSELSPDSMETDSQQQSQEDSS